MSYTMSKHLQYNIWASGKIVEFLSNADEKVFDSELSSSFPSIKKTILHIWDAEVIWHKRMQGKSLDTWPSATFNGTNAELLAGFVAQSKLLADFIESKGEDFLQANITYMNMKGDTFTSTVEEILFHVVNHGTFHRGQLITMMRSLGLTQFSSEDLITFLRK